MEERLFSPEMPSDGMTAKVPPQHWEDLALTDPDALTRRAVVDRIDDYRLRFHFLNLPLLADIQERRIFRKIDGKWAETDEYLLELMSLVYLLNAKDIPIDGAMVSVKELKDAHFFQGPHELEVRPLLKRFGYDLPAFRKAAEALGGDPRELADASYRLLPFPRIPIYYLLWEGDEEFNPRISVLFDRSIEFHLSADGVWGLVNLVSDYLVRG